MKTKKKRMSGLAAFAKVLPIRLRYVYRYGIFSKKVSSLIKTEKRVMHIARCE